MLPYAELRDILLSPIVRDPLAIDFEPSNFEEVKISGSGLLCLVAYWLFGSDVFDADQPKPEMYMFPDQQELMAHFLGDDPQSEVANNPGTVEALVVLGIWLDGQKRVAATGAEDAAAKDNYMPYHHLITLISVFHANIRVRNAATVVAGTALHSDPDEEDRLSILEDLLENCMFASLQACAVTWLREEVIAARKAGSKGRFNSPECFEALQYSLFPDLTYLKDADIAALLEFWAESSPFHMQVTNLAQFLYGSNYGDLAPVGMAAAIEHRYVQPLLQAAKTLTTAVDKGEVEKPEAHTAVLMELRVLMQKLEELQLQ